MYSSWDLNVVEDGDTVHLKLIHHCVPPMERTATMRNIAIDTTSAMQYAYGIMDMFRAENRDKFTLEIC